MKVCRHGDFITRLGVGGGVPRGRGLVRDGRRQRQDYRAPGPAVAASKTPGALWRPDQLAQTQRAERPAVFGLAIEWRSELDDDALSAALTEATKIHSDSAGKVARQTRVVQRSAVCELRARADSREHIHERAVPALPSVRRGLSTAVSEKEPRAHRGPASRVLRAK